MVRVLILKSRRLISPRVPPRRSGVVRVLILKSGAPHQSEAPSSEFKGGKSTDLKIRGGKSSDLKIRGAPSVPGSILGVQRW